MSTRIQVLPFPSGLVLNFDFILRLTAKQLQQLWVAHLLTAPRASRDHSFPGFKERCSFPGEGPSDTSSPSIGQSQSPCPILNQSLVRDGNPRNPTLDLWFGLSPATRVHRGRWACPKLRLWEEEGNGSCKASNSMHSRPCDLGEMHTRDQNYPEDEPSPKIITSAFMV